MLASVEFPNPPKPHSTYPTHNFTGPSGIEAVARIVNDTWLRPGSHIAGGCRVLRRRQQNGHDISLANRGACTHRFALVFSLL